MIDRREILDQRESEAAAPARCVTMGKRIWVEGDRALSFSLPLHWTSLPSRITHLHRRPSLIFLLTSSLNLP